MIRYYVNKFGTLSFSQLCRKNMAYSPAMVQRAADTALAAGAITKTENLHHKTGILVAKYHSLTPVRRNIKPRAKKYKPEPQPQHITDANRLKRIIARRPGITAGLLLNSAKWADQGHVDALHGDNEVICLTQTHSRTGKPYTRYYMNYDLS